jgi:hypothetical protein
MVIARKVPSAAQQRVIRYIQKNTGLKFKGKTMDEARDFISKNILLSQRLHKEKMMSVKVSGEDEPMKARFESMFKRGD